MATNSVVSRQMQEVNEAEQQPIKHLCMFLVVWLQESTGIRRQKLQKAQGTTCVYCFHLRKFLLTSSWTLEKGHSRNAYLLPANVTGTVKKINIQFLMQGDCFLVLQKIFHWQSTSCKNFNKLNTQTFRIRRTLSLSTAHWFSLSFSRSSSD